MDGYGGANFTGVFLSCGLLLFLLCLPMVCLVWGLALLCLAFRVISICILRLVGSVAPVSLTPCALTAHCAFLMIHLAAAAASLALTFSRGAFKAFACRATCVRAIEFCVVGVWLRTRVCGSEV